MKNYLLDTHIFIWAYSKPEKLGKKITRILENTNNINYLSAISLVEIGQLLESRPKDLDIKIPLASGDMVLMRGPTQSNWLHSIPKRKGGEADRGRINITLRRAMIPAGTENYYRYNVGEGDVYKWDKSRREMVPWSKSTDS